MLAVTDTRCHVMETGCYDTDKQMTFKTVMIVMTLKILMTMETPMTTLTLNTIVKYISGAVIVKNCRHIKPLIDKVDDEYAHLPQLAPQGHAPAPTPEE